MFSFLKNIKCILFLSLGSSFVIFFCRIYLMDDLNNIYSVLSGSEESVIHVITNYPVMTEKPWNNNQTDTNKTRLMQRQYEIEETLQRNLDHPLISTVHLLVNQPSAKERLGKLNFHNKHKIHTHLINAKMPRYRDFFEYVNDRLLNRLVVITNMDIYIGEGFEKLNKTFLVKHNVSYVLTRSGRQERICNMHGRRGYCQTGYIGSHDTYIFVLTRRLEESVLSEFNYQMHLYGGDNVMLWVLRNRMKKTLLNPCRYLKTYHNHCVNIHSSVRPRINTSGKSAWVPPSELYT
ncbi:uncharacterized protein LOC114528970 [Dendronephthya gigantea]|uniref:uncharacterized protein LOC114528970 n=1 Tax=Dendronephthya gigantea TaxID=151771 RepID=UPI001068E743|nr:uncharacterized protein LOC114528970 [Dendronephthya gigantea]